MLIYSDKLAHNTAVSLNDKRYVITDTGSTQSAGFFTLEGLHADSFNQICHS